MKYFSPVSSSLDDRRAYRDESTEGARRGQGASTLVWANCERKD